MKQLLVSGFQFLSLSCRAETVLQPQAEVRALRSQALNAECWFLRCPAESALRLLGEALKPAGIVHRQVGQDLAIQLHAAFLEAVNELVVAHPVQFGGGADAHNPERAVLPLFLFASGVSELEPALHRFFGGSVEFGFG